MKAKELFEKEGWKQTSVSKNQIIYQYGNVSITFNRCLLSPKYGNVSINTLNFCLSKEELQAILLQLEELNQ
jgi:hypothetical protein